MADMIAFHEKESEHLPTPALIEYLKHESTDAVRRAHLLPLLCRRALEVARDATLSVHERLSALLRWHAQEQAFVASVAEDYRVYVQRPSKHELAEVERLGGALHAARRTEEQELQRVEKRVVSSVTRHQLRLLGLEAPDDPAADRELAVILADAVATLPPTAEGWSLPEQERVSGLVLGRD